MARITGRGLCTACYQRDPAGPSRYAKALTSRLAEVPDWFGAYVDYLTERYSPATAVHHLRCIGVAINASGASRPDTVAAALGDKRGAFDDFVVTARLGFAHNREPARAAKRRRSRLAAIPAGFAEPAQGFCDAMLRRQARAVRLGVRSDRNRTIEARLDAIRTFVLFTEVHTPHVNRVELVTVAEIEAFLGTRGGHDAATQLAYLRQFFTWCRRHKRVLADPTAGLWRDSKPVFAGPVLTVAEQRRLCKRWNQPADVVHPYEPAIGLLAMLHALSRRDIVALKVGDLDASHLVVSGRPEPVPLDPVTRKAIGGALNYRESLATQNPYLIVNSANARTRRPASGEYVSGMMANGPRVPLRMLRATRLSALVGELDPITISTALGIDTGAAMYYLNSRDPTAGDKAFGTGT